MADGDYKRDRERGDKLLPEVKRIISRELFPGLLIDECGEEDMKRCTDLLMPEQRIGVRIREFPAYRDHPDWRSQFTIRFKRKNGCKTEFQKIMEGYGIYNFYGFKDESGEHLKKWTIGFLPAFRKFVFNEVVKIGWKKMVANREQSNKGEDGSTFLVFEQDEIPGFVIATWEDTD